MNDLANKYLYEGYNVIVDSNSDRYSTRKELYEMAFQHNATSFCFWIKTDISTVKRRQNISGNNNRSNKPFIFESGIIDEN